MKNGLITNTIYNLLPKRTIKYVMNFKTRESIYVQKWLKKSYDEVRHLLEPIIIENKLISNTSEDKTAINCLRWVKKNVKYISDYTQYKTSEYWATPEETLISEVGDCEDGAVLLFCLMRACGISHKQVFVQAGNVVGGGHAYVKYISKTYPYVVYYLDWCYWYDSTIIRQRKPFVEKKGKIMYPIPSTYQTIWFFSNDIDSFK